MSSSLVSLLLDNDVVVYTGTRIKAVMFCANAGGRQAGGDGGVSCWGCLMADRAGWRVGEASGAVRCCC